ncbi:hypothetical protein AAC387_Pa09g0122 [Persea americana]
MKKRSSNKEVNRCSHLIVGLASRWTVEEKTTNFLINGKEPSGHTRHAICVLYSVRAGGSGDEGKVARRKETNSWKIDFSGEKPATPLLDTINYPIHMKNLSTRSIKRWSVTLKTRKHQLSMRLKELLGYKNFLGIITLTRLLRPFMLKEDDQCCSKDYWHQVGLRTLPPSSCFSALF